MVLTWRFFAAAAAIDGTIPAVTTDGTINPALGIARTASDTLMHRRSTLGTWRMIGCGGGYSHGRVINICDLRRLAAIAGPLCPGAPVIAVVSAERFERNDPRRRLHVVRGSFGHRRELETSIAIWPNYGASRGCRTGIDRLFSGAAHGCPAGNFRS